MKFLRYDGILAQTIRYIFQLFVLNLCFVLCCLPVVTAGAAIAALYSVFLNQRLESGRILPFFRAFRENFRQATAIWLAFCLFVVALGTGTYLLFTYRFPGNGVLKILTGIVGVIGLSVEAFVFPLAAHYENTTLRTWRNALVLGISLIPYGVILSAISLLPLVLFFIDLDILVIVLAIWLPLGGALSAQINSWILKGVFNRLQPADGESPA